MIFILKSFRTIVFIFIVILFFISIYFFEFHLSNLFHYQFLMQTSHFFSYLIKLSQNTKRRLHNTCSYMKQIIENLNFEI